MIEANKKQAKILEDALEQWQQDNLLSPEQAEQLKNHILVPPFDWQKLARYAFILAIICVVGAVLSILADKFLLEFLFDWIGVEWGGCIFFSLLATIFLVWGGKKKSHPLEKKLSSEALLAVGGIFAGAAIGLFGSAIDTGSGHFSILLLMAGVLYGVLAWVYHSVALWYLLLISSTAWFGSELAYWNNFEEFVLGLRYPIWYLLWGGGLVGISKLLEKEPAWREFAWSTYGAGLLVVFFNLWLLSFDFWYWRTETQWMSWVWTAVLALAAIAALVWGIRKEDVILKALGLGFLLLNIYSKYIQFFWEELHSAIFFGILALSFWLIGSRAEDIWSGRFWKGEDDLLDGVG